EFLQGGRGVLGDEELAGLAEEGINQ
ncbi:MAG: hypothetical protein ACI9VR_005360, partial [Cognaticolwellia sp.]